MKSAPPCNVRVASVCAECARRPLGWSASPPVIPNMNFRKVACMPKWHPTTGFFLVWSFWPYASVNTTTLHPARAGIVDPRQGGTLRDVAFLRLLRSS
jgi:hypothetical protein